MTLTALTSKQRYDVMRYRIKTVKHIFAYKVEDQHEVD